MYINNIILYLCIIIYIQFVNAYETGVVLSKDEVLKITNEYYISFFCKNDTCVSTSYDYNDWFIEIPDENGNLIQYITRTCSYDEIKNRDSKCLKNCTIDSQCLSNKCIGSCCVFNDETPMVHCDDIYTYPTLFRDKSSYMHCGKPWKDTCKTDDECSSKICVTGTCNKQKHGPKQSDGTGLGIQLVVILFISFIIIIIFCNYCIKKYPKSKKYIKYGV